MITKEALLGKMDIKSMTLAELTQELEKKGEPSFRAKQIYQWLHIKCARSFSEMTNLSKDLRKALEEEYFTWP